MTSTVTMADDTPLLVRGWAAVGDRWAHMLLVHGIAEHSERYERTGRLLAKAGIDVTAFDLRGHGGSGGRRGDVERWTDYLDDIAVRLAVAREEADSRPVVMFAHSYGGLISTDYVLSGRPVPDLLVLSAPALDDELPRWQHILAPLIARISPTLAFKNAWGPEVLSRDPEVGRLAQLDPASPERMTVRLGAFGFAAQERVRATLATLTVPTLVFHGSDDRLVPPRARGSGPRCSTSRKARRWSPTSSRGCAARSRHLPRLVDAADVVEEVVANGNGVSACSRERLAQHRIGTRRPPRRFRRGAGWTLLARRAYALVVIQLAGVCPDWPDRSVEHDC